MAKTRHMDGISIHDLRRRVEQLRTLDLRTITQEALATRVARLIHQYPFQTRPWGVSGLYRARVNKPGALFSNAGELWYPPRPGLVTSPSRLNRAGQIILYTANTPNTAAIELGVEPGDAVTVLVARTRSGAVEQLTTAFIGLERSLGPEAKALGPDDLFRTASRFRDELGEGNYKKWILIDEYLSDVFGTAVPDGETHLYKPTIALAELLLTAPNVDAISYPSVATNDHGINVGMLPAKADAVFAPSEAWVIDVGDLQRHPDTGEHLMQVRFRQRSSQIGPDGVFHWCPEGEGIDQESIMRFVRGRMELLKRWPTKP